MATEKGDRTYRFATRTVHAGQRPDPTTGAVTVPLYLTSTYRQKGIGESPRYEYSRVHNPTRDALEAALAALEDAAHARVFSSGMAAIQTLFQLLKPGDHVVMGLNVYGGTYRLMEYVFRDWGLQVDYVYPVYPENLAAALRPGETRLVLIETPSNPLLEITDIERSAEMAHRADAWLVVDNTFATPYLQNPLQLGADIVVHSTTKYLNGHSDSLGGVLVYQDPDLDERVRFIQKSAGAILSPFEAWLILRGLRTLAVRMERHQANAMEVARFLEGHGAVKRVYYPGLEHHPGYAIHRQQARGGGGMVSFELEAGVRPDVFSRSLELCIFGESLGGVETLVCHPETMTHASLSPEQRFQLGITSALFRISVGLEDPADICADLEQALERAST